MGIQQPRGPVPWQRWKGMVVREPFPPIPSQYNFTVFDAVHRDGEKKIGCCCQNQFCRYCVHVYCRVVHAVMYADWSFSVGWCSTYFYFICDSQLYLWFYPISFNFYFVI